MKNEIIKIEKDLDLLKSCTATKTSLNIPSGTKIKYHGNDISITEGTPMIVEGDNIGVFVEDEKNWILLATRKTKLYTIIK